MPPAAVRPSARYRSVVVVLLLAFLLLGVFALGRLPVDLPPASDAPRLNLRISAPGLIAPVLEQQLTPRLERALAGRAAPVPGWALTPYRWLAAARPAGVALRDFTKLAPMTVRPAARRDAALARLRDVGLVSDLDGRVTALGVCRERA